jgi:hypothetical protein
MTPRRRSYGKLRARDKLEEKRVIRIFWVVRFGVSALCGTWAFVRRRASRFYFLFLARAIFETKRVFLKDFIFEVPCKRRHGEQEKSKDYILGKYESQLPKVYEVILLFDQEDHAHLA